MVPPEKPLGDAVRIRLAKLLRMLASPHDGERAAAGRQVNLLVAAHGLDWDAVLQAAAQQVATTSPPPTPPRTWAVVVEEILAAHFNALRNAKELAFVTDLLSTGLAPSEGQGCWLADICDRCGLRLWEFPPPPSLDVRRERRLARQAAWSPRRSPP